MSLFLVTSDLHSNGTSFQFKKVGQVDVMKDYVDQDSLVFSLGDLTDNGYYWGYWYMNLYRHFINHFGITWGDDVEPKVDSKDQLQYYLDSFVRPLEERGAKVISGLGNHDTYSGLMRYTQHWLWLTNWSTIINFYRQGSLNFILCHLYPNWQCRFFLWLYLLYLGKEQPIVLLWHYNIKGPPPTSTWWSEEEKQKVYELIKDYNIVAIFNGHWHHSYVTDWHGIRVYGVGGYTFALGKMKEGNLSVEFHR